MGNRSSIFVECGNAPLEDDRPHANVVSPVSDEMTIEFITDVEGNWEYFLHYVSKSSVLYFEGDEMGVWGPGTLTLHDNCMLVFGGDAVDKGTGDIRFTKTLLSLKERYWDRVLQSYLSTNISRALGKNVTKTSCLSWSILRSMTSSVTS